MSDLWLTLVFKSTAVLTMSFVVSLALRRSSAAVRHLNWVIALATLLIMPVGLLLPPGVASAEPVIRIAAAVGPLGAITTGRAPSVWVTYIWFVGMAILAARLAIALGRVLMITGEARKMRSDSGFEVGISNENIGPVAFGLGRALVLLPQTAQDWPEDRRRAVLLHEAAHLRRNDCWVLLVAELACAVYWFHPLVWYAARAMRREQEHAADDHVLRAGVRAADYAEHLIAIARAERQPVLMAGAVTRSELGSRVKAILDAKRRRTMITRRMLAASVAAALAIALPLAALAPERKVYKMSDEGVTPPRLVVKHEPQYTEYAKNLKIEGTVVLSVLIDTDGFARDISVVKGIDAGLDANAVSAIETWQFKPAQKDGQAVAVAARVEVNFRLK